MLRATARGGYTWTKCRAVREAHVCLWSHCLAGTQAGMPEADWVSLLLMRSCSATSQLKHSRSGLLLCSCVNQLLCNRGSPICKTYPALEEPPVHLALPGHLPSGCHSLLPRALVMMAPKPPLTALGSCCQTVTYLTLAGGTHHNLWRREAVINWHIHHRNLDNQHNWPSNLIMLSSRKSTRLFPGEQEQVARQVVLGLSTSL